MILNEASDQVNPLTNCGKCGAKIVVRGGAGICPVCSEPITGQVALTESGGDAETEFYLRG